MIDKLEDRWHQLGIEDQQEAIRVNHFFCLLHVLLGLSDAGDQALKEYESILTDGKTISMGRD